MTVIYNGNGEYNIHFAGKKVELSEEELSEIQNFDFKKGRNFHLTRDELEEELEEEIDIFLAQILEFKEKLS